MKNTSIGKSRTSFYSRRRFIHTCTACAACMALAPTGLLSPSCSSAGPGRKTQDQDPLFLTCNCTASPDWPNIDMNFGPAMERINNSLKNISRNMEFLPVLATGPEDAEKIVEGDKPDPVDGYIVFQMNCWNRVIQTIETLVSL